jgi:hypothetical protein
MNGIVTRWHLKGPLWNAPQSYATFESAIKSFREIIKNMKDWSERTGEGHAYRERAAQAADPANWTLECVVQKVQDISKMSVDLKELV